MIMKQTAVEWLSQQILDNWNDIQAGARDIMEFVNQAKEMEKEQMMDCYLKADVFPRKYEFEEYYKETYGK